MRYITLLLLSSLLLANACDIQATTNLPTKGDATLHEARLVSASKKNSLNGEVKNARKKVSKGRIAISAFIFTGVGLVATVLPIIRASKGGENITDQFQRFLALLALPFVWAVSITEMIVKEGCFDPGQEVITITVYVGTCIILNLIAGVILGYLIEFIRNRKQRTPAKSLPSYQAKRNGKISFSAKESSFKRILKHSLAQNKKTYGVLLSGLLLPTIFFMYRQYTYRVKYNHGRKLIEERVQQRIQQKQEKKKSPILETTTEEGGAFTISNDKQGKMCIACIISSKKHVKTTHAGQAGVCQECVADRLSKGGSCANFLKSLTRANSHLSSPYNLNDPFLKGRKVANEEPVYLTVADLRVMGATDKQIKAYTEMSHTSLQIKDQSNGGCSLCEKNHATAKCPSKESIIHSLAQLYASHAGYGRKGFKELFVSLFVQGPASSGFSYWLFATDEHPCPSCGVVTSKDENCDTVTCDHCKVTWNWHKGLLKGEEHSHKRKRIYKLKEEILPWIPPFDPNFLHKKPTN